MGTVTNSIGTSGRDYSTLQTWEDALPANLTSDGNAYRGECYNDSEFTSSSQILNCSGHTTDSTNKIILTAAAGQSFVDHANVRTNALDYNASNGVGIRHTGGFASLLVAGSTQYIDITRLQFKQDDANSYGLMGCDFSSAGLIRIDQCIFKSKREVNGFRRPQRVTNSVFIKYGANAVPVLSIQANFGTSYFTNCTVVSPSDSTDANRAFQLYAVTATLKNVAVFGCTAFWFDSGSGSISTTTCATDLASAPSGTTTSLTYADQFEVVTESGLDLRLASGSDLIDAGTDDATYATVDISDFARPSGSVTDIGAWEYGSGGTTYNDSISDSITAAETASAVLAAVGSVSDASTAAEAVSAVLATAGTLSDAATVADALATALAAVASLADPATVADALVSQLATAGSLTDAASLGEAVVGGLALAEAIADAATLGEALAAVLAASATVSDAASLAESLAAVLTAQAALSDGATVADVVAALGGGMDTVPPYGRRVAPPPRGRLAQPRAIPPDLPAVGTFRVEVDRLGAGTAPVGTAGRTVRPAGRGRTVFARADGPEVPVAGTFQLDRHRVS